MTSPDVAVDEEGARLVPVDGSPQGAGRALRLFATGVFGGLLTLVGLGVVGAPHSHRCCGDEMSAVTKRERQRRCMELGVTMAELDRLEPLAAAAPAGEE